MDLVELPNAELLVSAFLRLDADLRNLVGEHVYTELPARHDTWPAVRITRIGGAPRVVAPLVLDEPLLQIDVWGGPKVTTEQIASRIRAMLDQQLPFTLPDEGTLGGVTRFGSLRYQPDTVYDPARPRYIFDVALVTRP